MAILDLLAKCSVDIVHPFICTTNHETDVKSFERVTVEGIYDVRKFVAQLKDFPWEKKQ